LCADSCGIRSSLTSWSYAGEWQTGVYKVISSLVSVRSRPGGRLELQAFRIAFGDPQMTVHRIYRSKAYLAKGLRTWTPASSKSLTLRVTTVRPCTRAVAAMSASITGRGCAY
jgi:hypothetical protein